MSVVRGSCGVPKAGEVGVAPNLCHSLTSSAEGGQIVSPLLFVYLDPQPRGELGSRCWHCCWHGACGLFQSPCAPSAVRLSLLPLGVS